MYTLKIRNAYFPETTFLSYCGARNRFGKDRFRNKRRSNGGEEGICTDSSSIDYAPIQCGNVTGKEEVVKGFVFPKVCETLSFNYNEIVLLGMSRLFKLRFLPVPFFNQFCLPSSTCLTHHYKIYLNTQLYLT